MKRQKSPFPATHPLAPAQKALQTFRERLARYDLYSPRPEITDVLFQLFLVQGTLADIGCLRRELLTPYIAHLLGRAKENLERAREATPEKARVLVGSVHNVRMLLKRANASPKRIGTTVRELDKLLMSVPQLFAARQRVQMLLREYTRYAASSSVYAQHLERWPERIPDWSKEVARITALLEEVKARPSDISVTAKQLERLAKGPYPTKSNEGMPKV